MLNSIQRMTLYNSSSHGKDKKQVWDRERTTPDILLEWDLPLLGAEMICGFSGFSSFFCVCEKFSNVSFEHKRIPGPDLGSRDRQLECCRTPSHLHHSRGKGSNYQGQLPSGKAASTLTVTKKACRGSSVTKSACLTHCGWRTWTHVISY